MSKPINTKSVTFAPTLMSTTAQSNTSSASSSSTLASTLPISGSTMITSFTENSISSTSTTSIPKIKQKQWFRPKRDAFDDDEPSTRVQDNQDEDNEYFEEDITTTTKSSSSQKKRKRSKFYNDDDNDDDEDNEIHYSDNDDEGNEEEEAGLNNPLRKLGKIKKSTDEDEEDNDHHDEENDTKINSSSKIKKLKHVYGEHQYTDQDNIPDDSEGVPIEPFHLRNEREEGYYDKDGAYVWKNKNEEEEEEDAWLAAMDEENGNKSNKKKYNNNPDDDDENTDSITKKEIKGNTGSKGRIWKADEADDNSSDESSGNEQNKETNSQTTKEKESLQQARSLYILEELLHDSETVVQALRRLGKLSTHTITTTSNQITGQRKTGSHHHQSNALFNQLTEATDNLVSMGMVDAYTLTKGQARFELRDILDDLDMDEDEFRTTMKEKLSLSNELNAQNNVHPTIPNSLSTVTYLPGGNTWEYCWTVPVATITNQDNSKSESESSVYGPFTSEQMNQWIQVGYFSSVIPYVRKVEIGKQDWIRLDAWLTSSTKG